MDRALAGCAGDALAEWQDSLHGGAVTDHEIFRRARAAHGPLSCCLQSQRARPRSTVALQRPASAQRQPQGSAF